jgi:hypothetical protein
MTGAKKSLLVKTIVTASLALILINLWGIHSCFDSARRNRAQYVSTLELSQVRYAMPVTLPSDRPIRESIQLAGLEGNPQLYTEGLRRIMMIFTTCILVSLFVLYATLILHKEQKKTWIEQDMDTQH